MNGCAQGAELDLELPARPTSVTEARHAARELARRIGAPDADVQLAVSEAVSNCVAHAFRGRSPGTVRISAGVIGEFLQINVSDNGTGMRPNLQSTGLGLGITLITKLAHDVRFDSTESGTTVSMSFPIAATGS
jgi:anti-sigma regulatory factor (Ser/Thr protein kinase)